MAIVIIDPMSMATVENVTLDRTLWLTEDKSRVVEDGDPASAFLYGIAGRTVPKPEAERLGALPLKMVKERIKTVAKSSKTVPEEEE